MYKSGFERRAPPCKGCSALQTVSSSAPNAGTVTPCIPARRTESYKWLEKACTRAAAPGAPDRWLVTLTEVEELKSIVRFAGVWLTMVSS